MTVAALQSSIEYNENGVTLNFSAPFRFQPGTLSVDRVLVSGVVVPLAVNTDFVTSGGQTDAGGSVTLTASIAGSILRIRRATPRNQATDYTTGDRFPAESHEAALDRAMLIDQEQDDKIGDILQRAILLPDGETSVVLPVAALRTGGNKVLGPNAVTGAIEVLDADAFQGSPGGDASQVGTFAAAVAMNFAVGINAIWTTGFWARGDGGAARYVRTLAVLPVDQQNWTWFNAADGSRWLLDEALPTSRQAGCRHSLAFNDQPALQALMDYCGDLPLQTTRRPMKISRGNMRINATVQVRPYVSIYGDDLVNTIIYPYMNAGFAFSSDPVGNNQSGYLQRFSNFTVDGTQATGSAGAWDFNTGCKIVKMSCGFWNWTGTAPAVLLRGSVTKIALDRCWFFQNRQDYIQRGEIQNNGFAGDPQFYFPTECGIENSTHEASIFQDAAPLIYAVDAAGFYFRGNTVQANRAKTTLFVQATASQPTTTEPDISDNYFEDNGNNATLDGAANGQALSIGLRFSGVVSKRITGMVLARNRFHQGRVNKPEFPVYMEYCTEYAISENREGFTRSGGGKFITSGGNNTSPLRVDTIGVGPIDVDVQRTADNLCAVQFDGAGAIIGTPSGIASVARTGGNPTGHYTITALAPFSSAASIIVTGKFATDVTGTADLRVIPLALSSTVLTVQVRDPATNNLVDPLRCHVSFAGAAG